MPDSGVAPQTSIPSALEAEQQLIGALLLRNALYDRVSEFLKPDHFADPCHGRIYAAISGLIESGRAADPITLKPLFDGDQSLAEVGGATYLVRLAASVISTMAARDYGLAIVDSYTRRQLMGIAADTLADAQTIDAGRSSADVLRDTEAKLFALGEARGEGKQAVDQATSTRAVMERIDRAYKHRGELSGVPTGLTDLDRATGGLHAGNLIIVAGRTGMGKSILAGTISKNAAKAGFPNAVFTLEMPHIEWTHRNLAGLTGISADRQRSGDLDQHDMNRLGDAAEYLEKLPIFIDDTAAISSHLIRQRARRLVRQRGVKMILVDHVQLMRQGSKVENRRLEIGEITGALKSLAKELGIPVVLLSQLSRSVESRDDKRPQLADLRESGDIEQDADLVLFVYRQEYYLERAEPQEGVEKYADKKMAWQDAMEAAKGKAEIIIAKNRMGQSRSVPVVFDGGRARFESVARGDIE